MRINGWMGGRAGAVLGAMLLGACASTPQLQQCPESTPKVLAIDDFEDHNYTPQTRLFARWQCYLYDTPGEPGDCRLIEPGFNSNVGHLLGFRLPLESKEGSATMGAGVRTITSAGTIDISSYSRLTFSAKLLSDPANPLPERTEIIARLGCAAAAQGSVPGGFSLERRVAAGPEWSTYALNLAEFAQPTWQSVRMDPHRCLTLLDGIAFHVQPALPSGGSAAGKLIIDTIYLQ